MLVVCLDGTVGAASVLELGKPLDKGIPCERSERRKEYHDPPPSFEPRAVHKERLAEIYHVAERDHHEADHEPDKHRLHEILPGAEGYPLPGEEEFPA